MDTQNSLMVAGTKRWFEAPVRGLAFRMTSGTRLHTLTLFTMSSRAEFKARPSFNYLDVEEPESESEAELDTPNTDSDALKS